MKKIGVIGGMSWQSSADYYRLLNQQINSELGGLHSARLLLDSLDFADIEEYQAKGDWQKAGLELAESAQGLERAGVDFIVLATNTMHKVADVMMANVSIPLLHIASATGQVLKADGKHKPLLLGTKFTMEQDFYKGKLVDDFSLDVVVAEETDRAHVHRIIYDELCKGVVKPESRQTYLDIIAKAKQSGADSVILGCTEIGMLVKEGESSLPVYDTTLLHVKAAADMALGK